MNMKRFNNVAVLMGGFSAERDVSLNSGKAVSGGLKEVGYKVTEIDVKNRDFVLPSDIDAVFIALHGEFGEDGQVQAILEKEGVPYTGSGPSASRSAFNKALTKKLLANSEILSPAYEILKKGDERNLSLPVVVKPSSQGSSIGVHRVMTEQEWPEAIADARLYGSETVVETYIGGRELTVGILGDVALPLVEIQAPESWYDYRAKYSKGTSKYVVPAQVDDKIKFKCQSLAIRTFYALGCRGFARVDFRVSADGEVYVLELNSIPGFTETSLLPKAAAAAGIGFCELCDNIINMAETGVVS